MKSKLTFHASILFLLTGLLTFIQTNTASAAECPTSVSFQSGYMYVAVKDSSATCTWSVPRDAATIDYLLIGGGGSGGSRHGGGGGGAAILGNNTATSGTANSGGGGGGSGCCNGGTTGAGGSGVAIFRYPANAGLTLSVSSTPVFRAATNIVATANINGRVTFYANGKVIAGCKNRSISSETVTCAWRPSVHGKNSITASIVSSTYSGYTGSSATSAFTRNRTSPR